LLKSPFSLHPSTGRVCVPIVASDADRFDPAAVPTIGTLLREYHSRPAGDSSKHPYEGTSMEAAIRDFEAFLQPLERVNRAKIKEAAERTACA
jgi:DNA primase small subunit